MLNKKLQFLALTFLGCVLGLALPQWSQAIALPTSGGVRSAITGDEDTYEVDPIDTGDYDEGTHSCEGATHIHTHYNDSTDGANDYYLVVHEFAIALDTNYSGGSAPTPATNDFLENVDTESLLCTDGDMTFVDCGFDKDTITPGTVIYDNHGAGRYNGVKITYDNLDWVDGDPLGLIWSYGTSDPSDITLKPWIASGDHKTEDIAFNLTAYDHDQTVTTQSWTKVEGYYVSATASHSDLGNYHHFYTTQASAHSSDIDPDGDYIYWYGLNATDRSIFPSCSLACDTLEITPTTADLSVSDVFSDVPFTVTATDTDGNDITADSTFQYYVNKYGSGNTAADASGTLKYGMFGISSSRSPNTTDSTVTFKNTDPGDSLYVYVSDYDGTAYPSCNAQVELPYCADLSITDPTGAFGSGWLGVFHGTSFSTNIAVTATASNGEAWPYDITYDSTDDGATYDGNADPYHTTDYSVDDYESTESATVDVAADNDVAEVCSDSFNYSLIPSIPVNTCDYLTITTPTGTVSAADMTAGSVQITWTAVMTDGTPVPPPYICQSSNAAGTFTDASHLTGTGSFTTSMTTVYYTGDAGDTINCFSTLYPYCTDRVTSESGSTEIPVCHDVTLSEPYITTDGGVTKTTIDLTNTDDIATLYDNTTVCYDYTVSVSGAAYRDTLVATGYEDSTQAAYSGTLDLTVNETSGSAVGNPASVGITGFSSYTGTVCWENYQPGNYMNLQLVGSPLACYEDSQLPPYTPPSEEIACTDLTLSPDSVVISSSATDAGTLNLGITVTGSDSTWSGTLLVTHTGTGNLFYTDGSASTAGDGHLEIPVSGSTTTLALTYVGGHAGDVVTAYISGEEGACTDNFSITQESTTSGGGGSSGGGIISGGGGTSVSINVCQDVSFSESEATVLTCEDYDTTVCVDTENGSEDIVVTREDDSEDICYQESSGDWNCDDSENGELTIENVDDGDCVDIRVENVCDSEEINVEAEGEGSACEDTLNLETAALGSFNKYIFTFNFTAEKSAYTDDGIFFAHDEDRAFYTLDYQPTGSEGEVVFTDRMWDAGYIESPTTHGRIDLATDYGEMTSAHAYADTADYTYSEITHMGFGDAYEEKSNIVASYVDTLGTSLPSFIAYIKYPSEENRDSDPIYECRYTYDEAGNRVLDDTDVCFDPNESPANSDPKVVIENAGNVESSGSIRVRYVGVIESKLDCDGTGCLTEEFENTAEVNVYSEGGSNVGSLSDSANLVVICSYLLTENAGDVYLNTALLSGSDLSCANVADDTGNGIDYTEYSNTDGLIILGDGSSVTPTSTDISDPTDTTASYCDSTAGNDSLIGNLSSYVCEIISSVSDLWKMTTVTTTTDSHLSQAIRNASTAQSSADVTVSGLGGEANWNLLASTLTNSNNSSSNILYFNGAFSGTTGGTLTIDDLTVPAGAWTIVVENGDLNITGDIGYATVDSADYNDIPSVAFVVLGGDINFENSSKNDVGVYYTDGDFTGETRSAVNQQLIIDGSLYGNIQPLLDACNYVAPPTQEGGGLVVRYDSRILLNTPPSLSEYVDVSTEKGIN